VRGFFFLKLKVPRSELSPVLQRRGAFLFSPSVKRCPALGEYKFMFLSDFIGGPQIAAVLLLGQRGLEELYSARNTQRVLAESFGRSLPITSLSRWSVIG
jgi:hypothetical protein